MNRTRHIATLSLSRLARDATNATHICDSEDVGASTAARFAALAAEKGEAREATRQHELAAECHETAAQEAESEGEDERAGTHAEAANAHRQAAAQLRKPLPPVKPCRRRSRR